MYIDCIDYSEMSFHCNLAKKYETEHSLWWKLCLWFVNWEVLFFFLQYSKTESELTALSYKVDQEYSALAAEEGKSSQVSIFILSFCWSAFYLRNVAFLNAFTVAFL